MTAGLQVFNDQGTLQFDSESPAYAFIYKGTVETPYFEGDEPDVFGNSVYAIVENLPQFDAYAVSCETSPIVGGIIKPENNTLLAVNTGIGRHIVTYYLYRSFSKLQSISGAGFECFSSNGQLSYSTAYRPLAIVAKHPITSQYLNMSEGRALPAGRQHAFIAYGSCQRDMGNGTSTPGDPYGFTLNAATPGARLIDGGYVVEEVRGNTFFWQQPTSGGFLVVDVTGL